MARSAPASRPTAPAGGDKPPTPAMRQFEHFKKQHPDCVLFFRMGDFYEMFHDDAKLAHQVLGVTLTQRTEGVPMAGVPYHAVEGYLRRMIQAGYRVAVCEQVEDPAVAKGVVKRDVTRIITPGTLTDESLLDEGVENPLVALVFEQSPPKSEPAAASPDRPHRGRLGEQEAATTDTTVHAAWVELSTGAFRVARFESGTWADELQRLRPRELLYADDDSGKPPAAIAELARSLHAVATPRPAWQFRLRDAAEALRRQFQVATLEGFGLSEQDDDSAALIAPAGAVLQYLLETQRHGDGAARERLPHLRPPRRYQREAHMVIDPISLRSLEVDQTLRSGQVEGSLLGVLRSCVTAMGKRLLRHWLCYPLSQRHEIEQRQRAVGALVEDHRFLADLRGALGHVQDVQRIASRIGVGRATPRDVVALGRSAAQAVALARLLTDRPAVRPWYDALVDVSVPLAELGHHITSHCVDAPPAHLREGGLIRDGVDAQLDEQRSLQRDSHQWLARYQKQLIEETHIPSLKIGYNKVFGYYIEVTAAHRDKPPDAWSRKQTLKNAERYITPQLKEFEDKVLGAESRAVAREQALFAELCDAAAAKLDELNTLAETAAELDVLACFASRAVKGRYVRPVIVDEPVLDIRGGRHPVLDEMLGDQFVPNDVELGSGGWGLGAGSENENPVALDSAPRHTSTRTSSSPNPRPQTPDPTPRTLNPNSATLALITGPNMAGKSTYIRQTALIVLLAHTGSFVPADSVTVGLCDRIFTRVGASDELHAGRSTFMVEMTETANIVNNATDRSLVIIDELGRGTSTFDGLSLAWAIAEFLAQVRCRTLFATHYHELTQLAGQYDNVANLNVTVREWQDQIVFLHRIVPGATDRSYGIHVAKLAGLPRKVVERAHGLLAQLAVSHEGDIAPLSQPAAATARPQPGLFDAAPASQPHPVIDELRRLDMTALSPMQAFDLVRQWRERID
jgi:DNA mismatch repair protein MutS